MLSRDPDVQGRPLSDLSGTAKLIEQTRQAAPAPAWPLNTMLSRLSPAVAEAQDTIAALRNERAYGRLSDAQMTDAIARNLGLPRIHLSLTPPDPRLASLLPPDLCLRHDCLPWKRDDDTLLIATARPEDFDDIAAAIARRLVHTRLQILPVVVARDELHAHLAKTHRPALTDRMRSRTPLRLSCRAWATRSVWRIARAIMVTTALTLAAVLAPAALMSAMIYLALGSMAVGASMKSIAAIARLSDRRSAKPPAPDEDDLPHMSILVPLFREPRIASRLITRLEQIDFPRDRLEILLILEEVDTVTRDALAQTKLPPWIRVITAPDGAPRTKPRAMNYALDFARGDIIGVYDAEDDPDPDQLRQVAAHFAAAPPDVVCLQGVLDYYNPRASWIARCFTIEYNTWFRLVLPGMARLGFALPLGGTTLFFRRAPLEQIGAWDAHNVTEDADLGFRLARAGYRTQVIDSTTREEANSRPLPWIRQRSRWLKGYMATYLAHMRNPLKLLIDLGPWQFLGFQAHFVTALAQFTLAPMLWLFWAVTLGVDLPFTTLDQNPTVKLLAVAFLGQELLTMILGAIATRRAGHHRLWAWVPLMHLYWPLGAIAMWKALYELVFQPFYWDKTEHGHSQPPAQLTVSTPPESSFNRVTKAREI